MQATVIRQASRGAQPPAGPQRDGLAGVFQSAVPRRLAAKAHLYHEGGDRAQLIRIEAGQVTLYRIQADGRRHVLGFAGRGSIIGLSADGTYAESAIANTAVTVRSLSSEQLERSIADRPELGLALFRLLSTRLVEQQARASSLLTGSAEERVAGFLLDCAAEASENGGDPHEVKLTVTRAAIAEYLGITQETISRLMARFRQTRLVDYSHPARLRLLDLKGLARRAGATGALGRPIAASVC